MSYVILTACVFLSRSIWEEYSRGAPPYKAAGLDETDGIRRMRVAVCGDRSRATVIRVMRFCQEPHCRGEGLRFCSKCRVVKYCCKECQLRDWVNHKTTCKVEAMHHHPAS